MSTQSAESVTVEQPTLHHQAVILKNRGAVVVDSNHPLAGRSNLSILDFRDYDFVATSPNESRMNYNGFIEICTSRGFMPKIARTARTLDGLLFCVEMGIGACLVDENVSLVDYKNLIKLPINDDIYSIIAAVWLGDNTDPRIRRLAEKLASICNS